MYNRLKPEQSDTGVNIIARQLSGALRRKAGCESNDGKNGKRMKEKNAEDDCCIPY